MKHITTQTNPALMTAEELLALYERRLLSPVEALKAVMERIARFNPQINAMAVMNPRALQAAGESEARWMVGRPVGVLDGVPTTVKDLVDVAGFPTRRGSRLTDPSPVAHDAPLVMGLKQEGAVIVGKTTTTEFGWKSPGDCPLHGITRNPWDMSRTPGGSSAGAGAAGAAGFGPLHVGTDAGGSIRIPAAWCGLVGVKPTYGRVPQWPAGAFASVAVAGPMTRSVRDAALMMSAMARFDPRDPFCLPDDLRDWRDGIEDGVEGMRIAVIKRMGFNCAADKSAVEAVERAAEILMAAGAHVEEADPELPDTREIFGRVWGVALARVVNGFTPEQQKQLDPGLLAVAAAEGGVSAMDFMEADMLRVQAGHKMGMFHQKYDLAISPTVPEPALLIEEGTGDARQALWTRWAPWTFALNLTRQPAIAVPVGLDANGLPRSVQVIAAQYRDDLALRAARVIEQSEPAMAAPVMAE